MILSDMKMILEEFKYCFNIKFNLNIILIKMSEEIEITINNYSGYDSSTEISSNSSTEISSNSSTEISSNSNNEISNNESSNYLINENRIFLNSDDLYSKCYVCFENTNFNSPCKCSISICNNCFVDIITNNGKNCTICRERFNEEVIEKIKRLVSNVSHSSESSYEQEIVTYTSQIRRNNNNNNICICYLVSLIIFSIPFFGYLLNFIFNNPLGVNYFNYFSPYNFIIGFVGWLFLLLILNMFILLYKLIIKLIDEIILLFYSNYLG